MKDERLTHLAKIICEYSINVQPNENVLIDLSDMSYEFPTALIEEITRLKGRAFVQLNQNKILNALYKHNDIDAWKIKSEQDLTFMKQMQGFIAVRNSENTFELSDVPSEKMTEARKIMRPVIDQRVDHTKWVVLRYPSSSMAQNAGMSTAEFEDFYFDVCTMDYAKMEEAAKPLVALMNKTDRVLIKDERGTLLSFSIKGIPAIACCGKMNIPDGEVFTAPIKESVNGVIRFNTPTVYNDKKFTDICLFFENGKIVKATGSDTVALNKILNTDDGARFIGEFALGFNPYVTKPMCDILFDEKIAGSFHFTPGACYEDASNGNHSSIHWDMVLIQTPECGGGEIWFDDVLIRKDGAFVLPELMGLNPENLK